MAVAELEDMINSVFYDPEQMNMISSLAKSLMGGEDSAEQKQPPPAAPGGLDPGMLGKIQQLMGGTGDKPQGSEALLRAMQPYLSEKRRIKVDKALKLARLAKLAGFAMDGLGGEKE